MRPQWFITPVDQEIGRNKGIVMNEYEYEYEYEYELDLANHLFICSLLYLGKR